MKVYIFTLVLFLTAAAASAAEIDGKWEGTYSGGITGKPMKLAYDFKADGNKLTGTATGDKGEKREIKNGKIDGNKIFFDVPVEMSGINLTLTYAGTLSGDELKLSFKMKAEGAFGKKGGFTFKSSKGAGSQQGETFTAGGGSDGTETGSARSSTFTYSPEEGSVKTSAPTGNEARRNEFIARRVK